MKHFKPYELVPPSVYQQRGSKSIQLLDNELLIAIDFIREELGLPITINDWYYGGQYSQRALRTFEYYHGLVLDNVASTGVEMSASAIKLVALNDMNNSFSQHRFGAALDFKVKNMESGAVRAWLIENRNHPKLRCIRFIEDGVSWVHIDVRPTENDMLIVWHVKTGKTKTYARD